ncbi:MAG: cytochrome-c oxidase, partial [Anaerolineae bacterium]
QVGTFALICNKLCGVGHAGMTTTVVVQTMDDFNAWLASRKASQTTTPTAAPTLSATATASP